MVSSSFYLKNAAAVLLMVVPLLLAVVVLAAVYGTAADTAGSLQGGNALLTDSLARLKGRVRGLEDTLRQGRSETDSIRAVLRRLDQPPLIVLSEADGYTFPSGTAEISADFARQLNQIIASRVQAEAIACSCDVVEVIGHTDGQLVSTRSNLDRMLLHAVHSGTRLSPGSNADLGLMRAWAVADQLRRHPDTAHLRYYGFSAAQVIEPLGAYALPNDVADRPERRRIEIRLRRRYSL